MIILTDKTIVIPVGISPNYAGAGKSDIKIQDSKDVTITENGSTTVVPDENFDVFTKVNITTDVKPSLEDKSVEITKNGDYNYTASAPYYGIGNFNVKVNVEIPVESEKTVNPSFNEDVTVVPSEGFDAMSSVIVKKAVANLEDKNVEITENGDYSYTTSAPYNGIGNLNVKVNVQEKEIRYAIRPKNEYDFNANVCILTHVLLNETSWVSLDFAMDTSSLNKEKAYLFGISASSLHCYLNNGVLHMYTGEEVPMLKQITLDTNKHTLEFGFTSKADESGHATFKVVFDGEVVAEASVLVPKFNLPLTLFDVPNAYDGTYDDYIAGGGISYLIYNIGYTSVNNSVFDLFALTVYDNNSYYRQTINAYTPSLDAENKPIFIDNITGEYQYPINGNYSYVKIDGDTRTEIASRIFKRALNTPDLEYFRPSEGAIVPTDIELPALHRITMYVKDIDSFDEGASDSALNNVKNRVMIGAQPVLVAPFNHIDYKKGLPRLDINDGNTAILGDTSVGLFNSGFEDYSGYTYSIATEYGGMPQAFASLKGEHTIKFGQRAADIHNIKTFFMFDDNQDECHTLRGIIMPDVITRVNERKMTPLCIFGTYNFVEGTKPDYVNSLGYQEALNQIGYTTGVRYAIKQIDIEEYPINSDDINTKGTLRHRLVTLNDINDVKCLFDTITGTTYYPYNGTLDVYTGPVEPEEPAPTLLTGSYVKPSAGAIVPTDIKFTSLTNVSLHVKGFDNFEGETNLESRAMIGAQPNFIVSPFNRNDAERGLPFVGVPSQEQLDLLGDSSIAINFNGCGNFLYSIYCDTSRTLTMDGEHVITAGYDPMDINNINMVTDNNIMKIISIDEQEKCGTRVGSPASVGIYQLVDDEMKTPICIFGNYNNSESMTPDKVIALGYENALSQIGYVTGARYGVKEIDIAVRNADGSMTTKHSLVPARDSNNTICLYDTVSKKSYYPYNGTLDLYTGPVEPEPPVDPEPPVTPDVSILTGSYVKPSAGAIVPTDIKFTAHTLFTMDIKDMDNFDEALDSTVTGDAALDVVKSRVMIGAQPNNISPFNHIDVERGLPYVGLSTQEQLNMLGDSSIGLYFGFGPSDVRYNRYSLKSESGGTSGAAIPSLTGEHTIKVGLKYQDENRLWSSFMIDNQPESHQPTYGLNPNAIEWMNNSTKAPICIFGTYNFDESKTPDDVIALGYENALNELGYTTGVRFGLKKIDIDERNADGSMTTTHSLTPARDVNGTICLYDVKTKKSYYPFHGTLDII